MYDSCLVVPVIVSGVIRKEKNEKNKIELWLHVLAGLLHWRCFWAVLLFAKATLLKERKVLMNIQCEPSYQHNTLITATIFSGHLYYYVTHYLALQYHSTKIPVPVHHLTSNVSTVMYNNSNNNSKQLQYNNSQQSLYYTT